MRAFMSTPGDGPLYYDGDTLAYTDGRTFAAPYTLDAKTIRLAQYAAEREARAILAETEPESASGCGYMRAGYLHAPSDAGEALAEALAAFVGEE